MKNQIKFKLVITVISLFILTGCGSNNIRNVPDVRLGDDKLIYLGNDLYDGQLIGQSSWQGGISSVKDDDPVEIIYEITNGKISSGNFYERSKKIVKNLEKEYITDDKGDIYFYYDKINGEFDGDKLIRYSESGKIILEMEGGYEGSKFIPDGEGIQYSEDGEEVSRKVFVNGKEVEE